MTQAWKLAMPDLPEPEVTTVRDRDGDLWTRDGDDWRPEGAANPLHDTPRSWRTLLYEWGPVTDATPAPQRPARLRTGRTVGRTLYRQVGANPSDDDQLIGVMDTPELAAMVVAAVNKTDARDGSTTDVSPAPAGKEWVELTGGQSLLAHAPTLCADAGACTIHNPSDHHMRDWPQNWRDERLLMERICPHGVGHPDPDDVRLQAGLDSGTHGCDGCCRPLVHSRNEQGAP